MVFCINCGKENVLEANFCYNCGEKLSNLPSSPLSEEDYKKTFFKYRDKGTVLDQDIIAISGTIEGLSLNAVELTLTKIDKILNNYSILLSEFKSIVSPENYKNFHQLWISSLDYSIESIIEFRKSVELNDQSLMDKAAFLVNMKGEKIRLANEELERINK
ncbi:hypothetical protein BK007_03930 [Methanobacterium subterraneum]|uniref:Uncharacterized protein n=1 Tax=Methanobacterium subterraneum TaxID=59277 RepID=A0A2H4VAX7_9EURY|nr:zinc ribbon domain-containing protein [Methanobacterium subterraneum]AUB55246.1 hypothetical protein BK007_03930 [Methanobacterium subterraneum]